MKLYISPSTQEHNTGPGGYIEEVQMNLIADILIPELIRHGQIIKRNNRTAAGVEEICVESNDWGADYHIAIHSNAFKGTVRGCEVYCYAPTDTARKGTQLAKSIYDSVTAIMPVPGRGIKSGATTMSEIAHTNAPSALIEIDYHDTVDGAAWIMAHTKEIAQALLVGILKHLGVPYIPNKDEEIAALKEAVRIRDNDIIYLKSVIGEHERAISILVAKDMTSAEHIQKLGVENARLNGIVESLANENVRLESDNAKLEEKIVSLNKALYEKDTQYLPGIQ